MKYRLFYIITLLSGVLASVAQTPKQWRDSLNIVNRQIVQSPDSTLLYLTKASICLQMAEWDKAVDACGFVIQKDPVNLSALYYRAFANNNLRRYSLARNDYEDFLRLSPRNMEARLGLAYTLTKLDRYSDALDHLNNLVEMYPDSSIVYAARAGVEGEMKAFDTALYDWDEAIKRDPLNHEYVISKAEILIRLSRFEEAEAMLNEAVKRGIPRGLLRKWFLMCH